MTKNKVLRIVIAVAVIAVYGINEWFVDVHFVLHVKAVAVGIFHPLHNMLFLFSWLCVCL